VLVGLYAYAFKKQIGVTEMWKYLLFIFIGWDVTYNLIIYSFLNVAQQTGIDNASSQVMESLVGWVIIFPAYYAIYKLGFKPVSYAEENA